MVSDDGCVGTDSSGTVFCALRMAGGQTGREQLDVEYGL